MPTRNRSVEQHDTQRQPSVLDVDHPVVDVLAADDHIIVVNKPTGLLSVPGRSAKNHDSVLSRITDQFNEAHTVHRLDMATSGIMVLARNKQSLRQLNAQFAARTTQKAYIAIVSGLLENDTDTIDKPLKCDWPNRPRQIVATDGKPSETRYKVLHRDRQNHTTRLALTPITGRSHQLRVHLQSIGHPILGDEFYAHDIARAMSDCLLLHAQQLSFKHPTTDEQLTFVSESPF